jgi:DNA-binding transcriptional regulator YdaS (Cro superfamily)
VGDYWGAYGLDLDKHYGDYSRMAKAPPTAHAKFAAWVTAQGSQRKAADALGISQSYVNKIITKRARPQGMSIMRAIELATRGMPGGAIRPAEWDVAPRAPKPPEEHEKASASAGRARRRSSTNLKAAPAGAA